MIKIITGIEIIIIIIQGIPLIDNNKWNIIININRNINISKKFIIIMLNIYLFSKVNLVYIKK